MYCRAAEGETKEYKAVCLEIWGLWNKMNIPVEEKFKTKPLSKGLLKQIGFFQNISSIFVVARQLFCTHGLFWSGKKPQ